MAEKEAAGDAQAPPRLRADMGRALPSRPQFPRPRSGEGDGSREAVERRARERARGLNLMGCCPATLSPDSAPVIPAATPPSEAPQPGLGAPAVAGPGPT